MRLLEPQRAAAERRIRSATLVAALLAILSLVVGLQSWRERRHLDLELLAGFVDSLLTLLLAFALSRHSLAAAWALLGLALLGALYTTQWLGFPLTAILPQAIGGFMYARAIPAVRFLREHDRRPANPS
jgi:hypothetical protein